MLKVKIFAERPYSLETPINEWIMENYDELNQESRIKIEKMMQSSDEHYTTISIFYYDIN